MREQLKAIDQQIKKLKQSSKSSSKQGDEIQALADARRYAYVLSGILGILGTFAANT